MQLSAESDYFARSGEFRTWLARTKGRYADELSAADARALFADFADAWNAGDVDADIVDGSALAAQPSAARTRHVWKLRGVDAVGLGTIRDEVLRETQEPQLFFAPKTAAVAGGLAPKRAPAEDPADAERRWEAEQRRRREDARRMRERHEDALDQVAPRETGREAMLAKRAAAREERRTRGESPDRDVAFDGDGAGSFAAAVASRDRAREAREARRSAGQEARLEEHRRKEEATMAALRSLAQASGGVIRDRPS